MIINIKYFWQIDFLVATVITPAYDLCNKFSIKVPNANEKMNCLEPNPLHHGSQSVLLVQHIFFVLGGGGDRRYLGPQLFRNAQFF